MTFFPGLDVAMGSSKECRGSVVCRVDLVVVGTAGLAAALVVVDAAAFEDDAVLAVLAVGFMDFAAGAAGAVSDALDDERED